MGHLVHRTTKQEHKSTSPSSLPEDVANYISEPDLSAVAGEPSKYWIITGDAITLMDQAAQDAVDAVDEEARLDSIADELDQTQSILKAFAQVMLDQLNILRVNDGLPEATLAQLKTAVRGKL